MEALNDNECAVNRPDVRPPDSVGTRFRSLCTTLVIYLLRWRHELWNKRFPAKFEDVATKRHVWSTQKRWAMGWLLAVSTFIPLMANLGYPLVEPDESRYAQIALEMYQSGDWIVPTLQGEPYLDKPPLLYWSSAACYYLFGESEWSARLPTAVAAWLTIVLTYVLGIQLVGDRAAWCGGVVLLLCGGFILCARFLVMDGLLTLMTTGGTLATARALFDSKQRMRWWLVAGLMLGLGAMVKGPVALLIAAPPVVLATCLSNKKLNLNFRAIACLSAPIILLTAPWFYLISQQQSEFFVYFLWKHHVLRFVNSFIHQEPWWYFGPVLLLGMFPVSPILPALLADIVGKRPDDRAKTMEYGFIFMAATWVVVFFSLSSCKLPTYILPAIPLYALAVGVMFEESILNAVQGSWIKRYSLRTIRGTTISIAVAGVIVVGINIWLLRMIDVSTILVFVTASCLIYFGVVNRHGFRYWTQAPWVHLVLLSTVIGPFGFTQVFPHFASWRSNLHHAIAVQRTLGDDTPIVFFGEPSDAAELETDAAIIRQARLIEYRDIDAFLREANPIVVVTNREGEKIIKQNYSTEFVIEPENARRKTYLVRPRRDNNTHPSLASAIGPGIVPTGNRESYDRPIVDQATTLTR